MKERKWVIGKGLLAMVLAASLLCGSIYLQTPQKASAKAVSKITKTVELTANNIRKYKEDGRIYYRYDYTSVSHKISVKKNEKLKIKVKVLDVEGKVFSKYYTDDHEYDLSLGSYDPNIEKGDAYVFGQWRKPKLKKSFFKKGKVLKSAPIKFIKEMKQTNKNLDKIFAMEKAGPVVNKTKTEIDWDGIPGITKLKLQITYSTQSGKAGINYIKEKKTEGKW